MSKSISYYDWELSFKKAGKVVEKPTSKQVDTNSLGLPVSGFKQYLANWKKTNL